MWGNIASRIGNVVERVKTFQNELELQLDAAVGLDEGGISITPSPLSPEQDYGKPLANDESLVSPDKYDDISLESPQPFEKQQQQDISENENQMIKSKSPLTIPSASILSTSSSSSLLVSSSSDVATTKANETATANLAKATATKATAELEKALTALRISESKSNSLIEDITTLKKEQQTNAAKQEIKKMKELRESLEKDHNLALAKIKAMLSQLEKENGTLKANCAEMLKQKNAAIAAIATTTTANVVSLPTQIASLARKEDTETIELLRASLIKLEQTNAILQESHKENQG